MDRRSFTLALTAGGLFAARARAAAWPERTVRFVISQPAGSGPDVIARLLGERLGQQWGQSVIIDNRPGGQNIIGAQAVHQAAPDGYTYFMATTAALVTNPLLFKQLPYDPAKDFVPVGFVARSPFALLVPGSSPIKTLDDWVARSKAAGGALTLGNEGPRTFSGMIARLIDARTRAGANLVPYASVSIGLQDLVGGHIDSMVADLAAAAPFAQHAQLRVLATSAAQRIPGWEQVPALAEKLPGFDMVGWFALVAPAGTPAAVVERVNRDLDASLADPSIAQRMAAIGPIADGSMNAAQTAAFLQREVARWSAIVKEIGVQPE